METNRINGKEYAVCWLLWKGFTYAEINNAVRCSNRLISTVKRKLYGTDKRIRVNPTMPNRDKSNTKHHREKYSKPKRVKIVSEQEAASAKNKIPKEITEIIHKAIRTRLISNNESKLLLSWVLSER